MNTCNHGFTNFCKDCKKEDLKIDRDNIKSGKSVYSVMLWQGDNRYHIKSSVKDFKIRSAADKHADKLNDSGQGGEHGYVVRLVRT